MGFRNEDVDYSLYLVTDSTMLPTGTTLYSQVEKGLQNGVTLLQIREKETETNTFIEEAIKIKQLCQKYNVPLIINDRIDIAMAIDADGVHVGQSDMPIPMVRKLLGPDKLIGWSVSKQEEVEQLASWGPGMVDNIGIGMVFPTKTKKNPKKAPMGPQGVIDVLNALETNDAKWCRTVAIGGLHPNCIPRVLYQCGSSNGKRSLDGIAVVSDIMAAEDAAAATKRLRELIDEPKFEFVNIDLNGSIIETQNMKDVIDQVTQNRPLIQHMTNKVHQNFGANVTLALGSSPIMSEIESEVDELSRIPNATLLLNTGSVAPVETLKIAVAAYNNSKRPIVLDPVGYSATETRLLLNNTLLSYGQYTCIKGNSSEILAVANMNKKKMKGVDADEHIDSKLLVDATRAVAFKYKTVAVCTGETDYIVDGTFGGVTNLSIGTRGIAPENLPCITVNAGPIPIMGDITASGCSLGSTIASFIGGLNEDGTVFDAVISAVAIYKTAGKLASTTCKGSGSFQVELIDSLYQLFHKNEPETWIAKIGSIV